MVYNDGQAMEIKEANMKTRTEVIAEILTKNSSRSAEAKAVILDSLKRMSDAHFFYFAQVTYNINLIKPELAVLS